MSQTTTTTAAKKGNTMMILIILGIVLVVASVLTYFFWYKPNYIDKKETTDPTKDTKDTTQGKGTAVVKPIDTANTQMLAALAAAPTQQEVARILKAA